MPILILVLLLVAMPAHADLCVPIAPGDQSRVAAALAAHFNYQPLVADVNGQLVLNPETPEQFAARQLITFVHGIVATREEASELVDVRTRTRATVDAILPTPPVPTPRSTRHVEPTETPTAGETATPDPTRTRSPSPGRTP